MSLCSPPLIETYREGAVCSSYACLYSSVLSLLQKPVNVRLMSRTVTIIIAIKLVLRDRSVINSLIVLVNNSAINCLRNYA